MQSHTGLSTLLFFHIGKQLCLNSLKINHDMKLNIRYFHGRMKKISLFTDWCVFHVNLL